MLDPKQCPSRLDVSLIRHTGPGTWDPLDWHQCLRIINYSSDLYIRFKFA